MTSSFETDFQHDKRLAVKLDDTSTIKETLPSLSTINQPSEAKILDPRLPELVQMPNQAVLCLPTSHQSYNRFAIEINETSFQLMRPLLIGDPQNRHLAVPWRFMVNLSSEELTNLQSIQATLIANVKLSGLKDVKEMLQRENALVIKIKSSRHIFINNHSQTPDICQRFSEIKENGFGRFIVELVVQEYSFGGDIQRKVECILYQAILFDDKMPTIKVSRQIYLIS